MITYIDVTTAILNTLNYVMDGDKEIHIEKISHNLRDSLEIKLENGQSFVIRVGLSSYWKAPDSTE